MVFLDIVVDEDGNARIELFPHFLWGLLDQRHNQTGEVKSRHDTS